MPRYGRILVLALSLALSGQAFADSNGPAPVGLARISLPADAGPVLRNIAALFARQVQERCPAKVTTTGDAPLQVVLAIEPAIGKEGFRIADAKPGTIRIAGNDARGVLYGVGKFLRTSRYDRGGFTPGTWRGTSMPKSTMRGMYFATHLHNFYHDAPLEEVRQYVQELGLWGFNSIGIWYDMRHAKSFDDPEAAAFRARLKAILQSAREVGVGTCLLLIGNEADQACPKELWANPTAQRGDRVPHYTCPNIPAGMDYTLKVFGRFFDWSADLAPEHVCIWPYDPGSCGCERCRPWGTNGFLRCAENVAVLARKKLPGVKIIVSTWLFDGNEWQSLLAKWRTKPAWADVAMVENGSFRGAPGRLPLVGFPEISMEGMTPWGGFGANPAPRRVGAQWAARKNVLDGGWPYSEGIFEDMDKVFCGQCYWDPERSTAETVREYAAFEFSPAVADDAARMVAILEENLGHQADRGRCTNHIQPSAREAFQLARQIDAKLTAPARQSWRWRILYLRALIDKELFERQGKLEGPALRAAMAELKRIYHADRADPVLQPARVK
jgi:hypothetical protein